MTRHILVRTVIFLCLIHLLNSFCPVSLHRESIYSVRFKFRSIWGVYISPPFARHRSWNPFHKTVVSSTSNNAINSKHGSKCQAVTRLEVKFLTSNPLKTREVQALLAEGGLQVPFDIVTLDIELPELQETPLVIAIEKTRLAAQAVQGPVLVEDTCLCFDALGDLPGPYIKHFLDQLGPEGLFRMIENYEDHSAKAVCNVGFSPGPGCQPLIFTGITYGEIVRPEKGDDGFGWDTCFAPSGFNSTFSKMTVEQKNAISHRSMALRQFQKYIADNWLEGSQTGEAIFL